MKSSNIFLFIFTIMNTGWCEEQELSIPHIKQYIKPGDIYSLDITKFIDLQTNSVDFRSNVDYVELPGFSKEIESLNFQGINFDPVETKYGKGSFFILQSDQRTILKISQQTLQLEKFVLDQYLEQEAELKCLDMILYDDFLWVLCRNDKPNEGQTLNYRIIKINYLTNQVKEDCGYNGQNFLNPKFKLYQYDQKSDTFVVFDQQYKKNAQFSDNQNIELVTCNHQNESIISQDEGEVRQEKFEKMVTHSQIINLKNYLKNLFKTQAFKFKVLNIMIDIAKKFGIIVIQEKDHSGKYVLQCNLHQEDQGCEMFLDKKVVHFFYKNSNYLYVDESLDLKFCSYLSDGRRECREGVMRKDWKIVGINLEQNRGLIAVEDNQNYYIFVNDFSTGYFNWYKDNLDGVKKIQLFQSEILDKTRHVYYMIKMKENSCDLQNLTFNKYVIVNSKKIQNNKNIEIFLGNIKVLNIEIILWNGLSLINYLNQDKFTVAANQDQLYSYKMPWITQAPKYLTNEIQYIQHFNKVDISILSMTVQQIKYHLQNSVFVSHENKLYAFQENYINVFAVEDYDLNDRLILSHEQKIEHGLLKDEQLKNIEKHGNLVFFNELQDNKINTYNFNDNSLNTYKFEHEDDLSKCMTNSNYLICTTKQEQKNSDKLNFYRIVSSTKIELDATTTQMVYSSAQDFIKGQTNSQDIDKIEISDFDLDSCNDEKLVVVYSLYTKNTQKPFLVEIKIKKHDDGKESYIYKQIFKDDLNAGDITADDKIYQFNGQTIVVQSEPFFKVFIQKESSYSELPFLESSSIKTYQINKQRGLLSVVYNSSFDQDYYIALYQLTSDASMQLVADYNIQKLYEQLQQDIYINMTSVSKTDVLINILKKEDNVTLMSFIFNQTGPVLYTKDLNNEIVINNQSIILESKVDRELEVQDFNYIKNDILKVEEFQDKVVSLKDFVNIEGNIQSIQIRAPETNQPNFKVVKIVDSIQQFHMLDYALLHQYCHSCILSENSVITSYSQEEQSYTLTNIDNLEAVKLGAKNCLSFDYDHINKIFVCLKNKPNNISLGIYFYWQQNNYKEDQKNFIDVPFDSVSLKLIHSTLTQQVYQVGNSQNNKLTFISIDSEKQTKRHISVDGKQLQADLLFIKDSFSFVQNFNSMTILNTIVYDQRANKMYINSVNLDNGKNIAFLNRVIDLNEFETQTYGMSCMIKDSDLQCQLIGKLNIYQLEVYKTITNGFNKFNWFVVKNHIFKNVLYEQTDDITFDPVAVFSDLHLVIANKASEKDDIRIVHYYKNNLYSDFVYKVNDQKTLVDMQIKQRGSNQYLTLLLKNQLDQVEVQIFTLLSQTSIQISQSNQKALLEKRQMKVKFTNGANLMIDFQIVNDVEFINDNSESFFQRHWFVIISVLLLCFLTFFLLIVLLVLLRERKKINMRMTMLNEGNANIPLNEI